VEHSYFKVSFFHSSGNENFLKEWIHEGRNVFLTLDDPQEVFDMCSYSLQKQERLNLFFAKAQSLKTPCFQLNLSFTKFGTTRS